MKQKIPVEQLRIGMYVAELDRPWLETPFLFQGFEIRDQAEINDLTRYCRHVYIATPEEVAAMRARTPAHGAVRLAPEAATSRHDGDRGSEVEQALFKLTNHPSARSNYEDSATLEVEVANIGGTYRVARELSFQLMEDARLGRSLDAAGAWKAVGAMVDSIIRNPDALLCFSQLKKRHEYTAQHSLRVCILALAFGRQLGFDRQRLNVLGIGALLHDVGKAKIPLEVLDKPEPLDARELELMKLHVPFGVEILEKTPGIPAAAIEVARCHHERFNGTGYASGLRGEDIGLLGLIGAIVDCYDAITSERAYHDALSPHTALKKMYEWRGSAFEPRLIEQFIQCLGIYPVGSIVQLNSGEIGVVAALNRVRRLKPRVVLVRRPDDTPYALAAAVNLETRTNADGRPCEVEHILEPEACGINPAFFLPVPAVP